MDFIKMNLFKFINKKDDQIHFNTTKCILFKKYSIFAAQNSPLF